VFVLDFISRYPRVQIFLPSLPCVDHQSQKTSQSLEYPQTQQIPRDPNSTSYSLSSIVVSINDLSTVFFLLLTTCRDGQRNSRTKRMKGYFQFQQRTKSVTEKILCSRDRREDLLLRDLLLGDLTLTVFLGNLDLEGRWLLPHLIRGEERCLLGGDDCFFRRSYSTSLRRQICFTIIKVWRCTVRSMLSIMASVSDALLTSSLVGMAIGWGGDGFCLPHPHPLLPYTYLLPYPYPTGMRNWISSPSSMALGIPAPSPSHQWINFF